LNVFNKGFQMTRNDRVFVIGLVCFVGWLILALLLALLKGNWFGWRSLVGLVYASLPPLAAIVAWAVPLTDSSQPLKTFMKAWFKILWSYSLVVTLGAFLLLVGFSAVGYLPYSDRPGPGWGNIPAHLPTLEEIRYFGGWAVFLMPMCYFNGSVLFIFMAWIRWLKLPTWLARIMGGLFCSGFTMIAVAAAGWYISIAVAVTNCVGLCALLFGAVILPRALPKREMQLSVASRTIGITLACLGMSALVVYPFVR
jgi:hypothetical protein